LSERTFAAPPTVIRPPPATANLAEGETLVIECEAVGVPTPIIVWRLNWGHVGEPPRVSTTTDDGQGKITIRNVRKEDEGAYTCEALNNKGSIFAQPDTILIVSRKCHHNRPYMDIFAQPDTIFIVSHVVIIALIWTSSPSDIILIINCFILIALM